MKVFIVHTPGQIKKKLDLPDRQAFTDRGLEWVTPNLDPLFSDLAFAGNPKERDALLIEAIGRCQMFVFRAYHDGRIPASLTRMIEVARKLGVLVLELPLLPVAGDRFLATHEAAIRDERGQP